MTKHHEDRFGFCPLCEEPNEHQGYVNVGKNHWMVCGKHGVKWPIGYNLFSDWQFENEETWRRNARQLEGYKKVEPAYCECAHCVQKREEPRKALVPATGDIPF